MGEPVKGQIWRPERGLAVNPRLVVAVNLVGGVYHRRPDTTPLTSSLQYATKDAWARWVERNKATLDQPDAR